MNACAGASFGRADADLNAAYRRITGRLARDGATRRALAEAQRTWVRFRDAKCAFATFDSEGGSIHPTLTAGCTETLTRRRIADLEAHMACTRDGACAAPLRSR